MNTSHTDYLSYKNSRLAQGEMEEPASYISTPRFGEASEKDDELLDPIDSLNSCGHRNK